MGQTHQSGTSFFQSAAVKDHFVAVQTLWGADDLASLVDRLKDMTLNFSLDNTKFGKLLQLSSQQEALLAQWFQEFSHDRASQVVDGLEFLAAAILINSKVAIFKKICLLFSLFDLDKTGCIRKDEFTIFLKAATTGLHRMVSGMPPPASVLELGGLSAEFFSSLTTQVLSQADLLMWITEAHYSLHYLSSLSRLTSTVFAWGANHRTQLGLDMQPHTQRVPVPVLSLEGLRVASIATNESHTLFLTEDGAVWSCGSGYCGLLGHGNTKDSSQPRLIESLANAKIIHVAVGVRHSIAVSDKGQVFTWGSADMGQLGHGDTDDKEVHEWAHDPRTGGSFVYVSRPTVVAALFGKKIFARKAACCNFTSTVLTDNGLLYSWGNNTDGQAGHSHKCPDHKLIFVDKHMQRTAMQSLILPRKLDTSIPFKFIAAGGYHVMAIDQKNRLWTWGQGLWGKLGHGDQRTMYEPAIVESLKYQQCHEVAAGESHSFCMCSLLRLTVTGTSAEEGLSPFSLLGLPLGRVDKHAPARRTTTPPKTAIQLNAFASGQLVQVALGFHFHPEKSVVEEDLTGSVALMDRSLWEGEWLKLLTTDFDFSVKMSPVGAQLQARTSMGGKILFAAEGKYDAWTDCREKICVFELALHIEHPTTAEVTQAVVEHAEMCMQAGGLACLCILPKKVDAFSVEPEAGTFNDNLRTFPFGVIGHEHGIALKKHVTRLLNMRIAEAPDGVPEEIKDWKECREDFTGRQYFENVVTGQRRWAPPQLIPNTEAELLVVREDTFLARLEAVIVKGPQAVIVAQQSWRPDVQTADLPEAMLQTLEVPVVMVTYEAGEELKGVIANGSEPWVTMEIQSFGGVYAWGNGTHGQLGLGGIENQNFLMRTQNALTLEENLYTNRPQYVAHLHEHQVTSVACGAAHTLAVTQPGPVFAWGVADGLGVLVNKHSSEVPMYVEQLEGLVNASKAYAGYRHSLVIADMPFKSIL